MPVTQALLDAVRWRLSLLEAGFTGIVTAKNGAKYHYVNGKRVKAGDYKTANPAPSPSDASPAKNSAAKAKASAKPKVKAPTPHQQLKAKAAAVL